MVLVIHGEDVSDTNGLEWSMAVKHIGKQEVEGLDFVIRVVKTSKIDQVTQERSSSKLDLLKCLNER